MKVSDYERDMLSDQKYAIECEYYLVGSDDDVSMYETYHFQVGGSRDNPFLDNEVDYFRVVSDEIVLRVHVPVNDFDEVVPSDIR